LGELNALNQRIWKALAPCSWAHAKQLMAESYRNLIFHIMSLSNDELFCQPMAGSFEKKTAGKLAEAAGAAHFRTASAFIRAKTVSYQASKSRASSGDRAAGRSHVVAISTKRRSSPARKMLVITSTA